jgi:hypothetical protein
MADTAHRAADATVDAFTREVARTYKGAELAARSNLTAFLSQFKAEDEEMRAKVDSGEITAKAYKRWRTANIMRGKQYRQTLRDMAQCYTNANEIATATLSGKLPQVYAENYNYGAYQAETGAGVSTSFNLQDADTVQRLLRDSGSSLPKPSVDTVRDLSWNRQLVGNQIRKGILLGESIDTIAERIMTVSGSNLAAATRTARTAVTAAESAGRVDSYKRAESMGIDLEQEWLATLDGRTRHSHRQLDGERVKAGGKFSNGCRYPGDPNAPYAEIMNCRCTLVAAVAGVDTSDGKRWSRLPKGESYEDWKAGKDLAPKPKPAKAGGKAAKKGKATGEPLGVGKLTKAQRDRLARLVDSKDFEPKAKAVYGKYIGNCTLHDAGCRSVAHFSSSPSKFGVSLNADKVLKEGAGRSAETWFHEFGHHFDYSSQSGYGYTSARYRGGAFGKKLYEEANAYVNARNRELRAEFEKRRDARDVDWLVKHGYVLKFDEKDVRAGTAYGERVLSKLKHTRANAYNSVSRELDAMTDAQKGDVSDLFGGATGNKAVDSWSHSARYWTNGEKGDAAVFARTENLATEGFAEFFSAYSCNPESKAQLQRYFPESTKIFEEILDQMGA